MHPSIELRGQEASERVVLVVPAGASSPVGVR